MTGFVEIVAVAMIAQLSVLPGEKVQFIIAGLSTKYNPLVVVAAAGSAFAGWTALEIAFGAAIQAALPGVYLDAFTAGMFLLFAVLLYRSAPATGTQPDPATIADGDGAGADHRTDGGTATVDLPDVVTLAGREFTVPDRFGSFLPIFLLMAAGEFGDKTQLITITLAAEYGATAAIWAGEMLAIIPVSLLNAYFFYTFSHRFDLRKAHFFGASLFGFFGLDTVLSLLTGFSIWETIVDALTTALLAVV
ncbi:TMEM165/GDT1 family protein [Halomicrobium sp. IBSBa]|uniref:TMEM165/GDT1 family protein n=1 Tax=Halomicrobium sp. IBSBa TaxID=2778916 RepID=UPI001ABF0C7D|nr:TMEM165/GDT1 family protein [Halomicrobium sp. IBSBa]MBO4247037.1 TMEM165/GDT1 family protein [Halomicrobium sp. IBSBa]